MDYLIISAYDGTYSFSVCHNGIVYETGYNDYEPLLDHIRELFKNSNYFKEDILKEYGNDYDLIIFCNKGSIEIIKDNKDYVPINPQLMLARSEGKRLMQLNEMIHSNVDKPVLWIGKYVNENKYIVPEKMFERMQYKENNNSIYRKLRDYIKEEDRTIWNIFGTLESTHCEFHFDQDEEWKTYTPCGIYAGKYDFLLDYYVKGIIPKYKIVKDEIIPYLSITLSKDLD